MPLLRPLERLHRLTARLPGGAPYLMAAGFVLAGLGVRYAANWVGWPSQGYPFLFFTYSVAAAAALNGGAGYFATGLSALACMPFVPDSETGWIRADWILPVGVFVGLGLGITALIESLHHALGDREMALAEMRDALRRRELLVVEHRHRNRGDLQSVASLLRLRARHVGDMSARAALIEAAGHATTLGAVHRRLESARHDADEVARVDSGCFVRGVCADLVPPVASVSAVSLALSTERSVALGLLLNEMVADARRDGCGDVVVRLAVVEADFILDVLDDRPSLGAADPFRTKLTALLAGQLRGKLTKASNVAGPGLAVSLRFPVLAPVLAPGRVGA